jgi:hypothetical protein
LWSNSDADLDESEFDHQPIEGFSPPRWTLGHLAICTDDALRATGGRFQCPKQWHRSFARGTTSYQTPDDLPSRNEWIEKIVDGFSTVRDRCQQMDASAGAARHSVPFLSSTPLTTVGHVLSHLMTTHFSGHPGQLSAWWRACGRPPVESRQATETKSSNVTKP